MQRTSKEQSSARRRLDTDRSWRPTDNTTAKATARLHTTCMCVRATAAMWRCGASGAAKRMCDTTAGGTTGRVAARRRQQKQQVAGHAATAPTSSRRSAPAATAPTSTLRGGKQCAAPSLGRPRLLSDVPASATEISRTPAAMTTGRPPPARPTSSRSAADAGPPPGERQPSRGRAALPPRTPRGGGGTVSRRRRRAANSAPPDEQQQRAEKQQRAWLRIPGAGRAAGGAGGRSGLDATGRAEVGWGCTGAGGGKVAVTDHGAGLRRAGRAAAVATRLRARAWRRGAARRRVHGAAASRVFFCFRLSCAPNSRRDWPGVR